VPHAPSAAADTLSVQCCRMYTLDTSCPFGGFKQSGIGREFGSEGLSEYVELQSTVSAGKLPDLG
jgi:acyl-CoA reductase-like NAD-dependent aldehyde dehydrogenase